MTKEGETKYVGRAFHNPHNDGVHKTESSDWIGGERSDTSKLKYANTLKTVCWARNEEHAVKIANERRIAYLQLQLVPASPGSKNSA
jgi:hypothetical protein